MTIIPDAGGPRLVLDDGTDLGQLALSEVAIGGRVGATPRLLHLPDGRSVEVLDNEDFDRALAACGSRPAHSAIRMLEARWRYALLAAAILVVGTSAFLRFGAPWLAARAVRVIPAQVDAVVGVDTLRLLDRAVFKPSALTPARQQELRRLFAEVTLGASADSSQYRLEFRQGGGIGANAIALPAGIVVLTDELEHLVVNDDELRGVLAHEVGHLVNRHAMRMLVQSSAAALVLGGLMGDVTGVPGLVTAAPAVFVNAAYSRDFERQADDFAFRWMERHHVPPQRLGELLARLTAAHGGDQNSYLSSHPSLQERVRAASR